MLEAREKEDPHLRVSESWVSAQLNPDMFLLKRVKALI